MYLYWTLNKKGNIAIRILPTHTAPECGERVSQSEKLREKLIKLTNIAALLVLFSVLKGQKLEMEKL